MNDTILKTVMRTLMEERAPSSSIDLWPEIAARLPHPNPVMTVSDTRKDSGMTPDHTRLSPRRLAASLATLTLLAAMIFLATPSGQAFAADLLQFFGRAPTNSLATGTYQLEAPAPAGADPASILDAGASIADVAGQVDYHLMVPAWTPDDLPFNAASLDENNSISRLFYGQAERNSLVIRQEKVRTADECDLCGKVGADADVKVASVNGAHAEYAQGVWNLTEAGAEWLSDPYLQTLRWQADGMAYELIYMGQPDQMNLETLVRIAESMK